VKGNIRKFFDSTPHKAILHKILQKVKCHRTLELLQRALRAAGYKDPTSGQVIGLDEGTSQGSVLSPLLRNIILHHLDEFVMKLRDRFNKGKSRRLNPEYRLLTRRMNANRRDRLIQRGLIPSKDPLDPYFRRIFYVRYADDFVILVSGTRLETFAIQASLQNFLHRSLGLELSLDKTMVSHLANKGFHFLGAYCKRTRSSHRILHVRTVRGKTIKQRSTERLRVCAPITKLFYKLKEKGFVKRNEMGKHVPTARSNLTPWAHADILEFYNQKVRGTLNYYSFASNRSSLNQIVHVLHMSCALTLASKYKPKTASKTFNRFGKCLACPATGMSLFRPGAYEAIHLYNSGPIARAEQVIDISWRSTRAALFRTCALCGSTKVGTHHIRYVKDVKARFRYVTSAYSEGALKRKQIPLCSHHHSAYNNGQLSESEMLALSLYTIHGEMFNCKIESS
jgi:hypothetical protein